MFIHVCLQLSNAQELDINHKHESLSFLHFHPILKRQFSSAYRVLKLENHYKWMNSNQLQKQHLKHHFWWMTVGVGTQKPAYPLASYYPGSTIGTGTNGNMTMTALINKYLRLTINKLRSWLTVVFLSSEKLTEQFVLDEVRPVLEAVCNGLIGWNTAIGRIVVPLAAEDWSPGNAEQK